jgi:hypothetical protein
MSNPAVANEQKQASRQPPERTPIRIEKLLFSAANPYGVKIPDGNDGKNERLVPFLLSGEQGEVKIDIERRPWLRDYRVQRSKRVTRSGAKGAPEVITWEPMGRPFSIPESWCVGIEEL